VSDKDRNKVRFFERDETAKAKAELAAWEKPGLKNRPAGVLEEQSEKATYRSEKIKGNTCGVLNDTTCI
jgi:hypothetical protein